MHTETHPILSPPGPGLLLPALPSYSSLLNGILHWKGSRSNDSGVHMASKRSAQPPTSRAIGPGELATPDWPGTDPCVPTADTRPPVGLKPHVPQG